MHYAFGMFANRQTFIRYCTHQHSGIRLKLGNRVENGSKRIRKAWAVRRPLTHDEIVEEIGRCTVREKISHLGWNCRFGDMKEEGAEIDMTCSKGHARIEIQIKASSLLTSKNHRNMWCFGSIRKRHTNKETKKTECILNIGFYDNPENFLALVGLEATGEEIDNPETNTTEIRRHSMLMPGKDVIKYYETKSKSVNNIEFSALPFIEGTPQHAKNQENQWVQYEKNFRKIIEDEERRQNEEYKSRKKDS